MHRGPASGCPPTGGGLFSPADRSGSRCSASHSSLEGDTIGVAYLAATTVAYLSLHTRALSSLVWAGVALAGLAGFLAGNPASLIQVLVAAGLAGVAFLVPAQSPSSGVEPTEIPVLVPTPSDGLTESAHDGRLRIRAIGRLALLSDGTDLAPALLAKRTLVFLWSYLLARAVAQMPAISRDQLADEVAPGLPTKSQRERLRKQLWDVQNDTLPWTSRRPRSTPSSFASSRYASARMGGCFLASSAWKSDQSLIRSIRGSFFRLSRTTSQSLTRLGARPECTSTRSGATSSAGAATSPKRSPRPTSRRATPTRRLGFLSQSLMTILGERTSPGS